jgi:hypothetical protein
MEQQRQQDRYYKQKDNAYTRVLQRLQRVQKAGENNQRVDRMWERLVEIALFVRTGAHRQPDQVLKAFIKKTDEVDTAELSAAELGKLRRCFYFLDKCYEATDLGDSRLAGDLPHFYTMTTSLLGSDLLEADGAAPDYPKLRKKLRAFAKLLPDNASPPTSKAIATAAEEYKRAATKQTTHPGQRKIRQERFLEIMDAL